MYRRSGAGAAAPAIDVEKLLEGHSRRLESAIAAASHFDELLGIMDDNLDQQLDKNGEILDFLDAICGGGGEPGGYYRARRGG